MKIFKDKALKEEVKSIDLGIVDAGNTKEYTYYLHNETDANVVELQAEIMNKTVVVVKPPMDKLKKGETTPFVFSWTPSISIKKGLKAEIKLKYYELYD